MDVLRRVSTHRFFWKRVLPTQNKMAFYTSGVILDNWGKYEWKPTLRRTGHQVIINSICQSQAKKLTVKKFRNWTVFFSHCCCPFKGGDTPASLNQSCDAFPLILNYLSMVMIPQRRASVDHVFPDTMYRNNWYHYL